MVCGVFVLLWLLAGVLFWRSGPNVHNVPGGEALRRSESH
jgi:hypothetical protein